MNLIGDLERGRKQYLRISYEHDGSMIGYLARAVLWLVTTEWKPKYGSLLSDRLSELNAPQRSGLHSDVAHSIFDCIRNSIIEEIRGGGTKSLWSCDAVR